MNLDRWLSYSVRRQYLDRDLEFARSAMEGHVLEIGAGHGGRRGRFVPPTAGCHWRYVDLETARKPDVVADAEQLPFPNECYDAVVALEMLEYTCGPLAALVEMRRVLKAGGMLVLSTPFLHRADTDHDFWRLTEPGLRHLLNEAGYALIWSRPQGHAFAVIANIIKHAIYVRPSGFCRVFLGYMFWSLFSVLLLFDALLARRFPTLASFSTGYLALAKRK